MDRKFNHNTDNNTASSFIYKKYLIYLLKNWYWLLLTLAIAGGGVYFFNKAVPRVYKMEAQIIFKKNTKQYDTRVDEALKNLNLLENIDQMDQESDIELLKSYQMIKRAMEKLDFELSYFKEGKLYDEELYKNLPFYSYVDPTPALYNHRVYIQILSADRYKVIIDGENPKEYIARFGEKFSEHGLKFTLYKNESYPKNFTGKGRYYFVAHKMDDLIKQYEKKLKVGRLKEESNIIFISTTGHVPEKERDFINALMESFKEYQFNRIDKNADASIEFINHHVKKIDKRLLDYENQLQALQLSRSQIRTYNQDPFYSGNQLDYASSSLYDKISNLENQKMVLKDTKDDFLYLSDLIKDNNNIDSIFLPMTDEINDAGLDQLLQELAAIQNQLNASSQNIQDDHPFYQSLNQQYEEQKKTLLTKVNIYIDHLDKSINRLDKKINDIKEKIPSFPYKERHYREMMRKIQQNEKVLDILSSKKIEFVLIKASKMPNYNILEEPRIADASVVFPNVTLNYLLAFFVGFILPGSLLIYRRSLYSRIEEKEEITNHTSIPVLHAIEHSSFKTELPVYYHPQSSIADGFRYIRTKLMYNLKAHENKAFMVTSMISGEGKSFVASNLATILAMGGKKTVIISADIRKPTLDKVFSMKNSVGLSDYLVTNLDYTKMIQPLPIKNLFFIPPGQKAYNTGDLFSERKIKNLLDHLYGHFEYIIFDSPPFSIIPESIIIAEQCHSNIFVVRHNYSPKNVIKSLEEIRTDGRLKNIHLLVNGIKTMNGFGLKYYYGYDSSYGFGYYNNYYNHKRNINKMPEHARVNDGAHQGG